MQKPDDFQPIIRDTQTYDLIMRVLDAMIAVSRHADNAYILKPLAQVLVIVSNPPMIYKGDNNA